MVAVNLDAGQLKVGSSVLRLWRSEATRRPLGLLACYGGSQSIQSVNIDAGMIQSTIPPDLSCTHRSNLLPENKMTLKMALKGFGRIGSIFELYKMHSSLKLRDNIQ